MNKLKKTLVLVCCAALLVCISVGATLAYLTSQTNVVENTFTVGNVKIKLDEALVNEEGEPIKADLEDDSKEEKVDRESAPRIDWNDYKLMPGHTYTKDPTVTVEADSEESFIRMIVTIEDITDVKEIIGKYEKDSVVGDYFLPQYLVEGWKDGIWKTTNNIIIDGDSQTYEFRYYTTVSTEDVGAKVLEPLFTAIKVPEGVTNDELKELAELKINIVAHAIQADGFEDDEDAAWDAFNWDGKALEPDGNIEPEEDNEEQA